MDGKAYDTWANVGKTICVQALVISTWVASAHLSRKVEYSVDLLGA